MVNKGNIFSINLGAGVSVSQMMKFLGDKNEENVCISEKREKRENSEEKENYGNYGNRRPIELHMGEREEDEEYSDGKNNLISEDDNTINDGNFNQNMRKNDKNEIKNEIKTNIIVAETVVTSILNSQNAVDKEREKAVVTTESNSNSINNNNNNSKSNPCAQMLSQNSCLKVARGIFYEGQVRTRNHRTYTHVL